MVIRISVVILMYNLETQGVDSVIKLARRTPYAAAESVKSLGDNDLLLHWQKPAKNK